MTSISIHHCTDFKVLVTYATNANAITLGVKSARGDISLTLYDLPETITNKLVADFGDVETIHHTRPLSVRLRNERRLQTRL